MTDQQDFRDMKFVVYIAGVMVALFAVSIILLWFTCNRAHAHEHSRPDLNAWFDALKSGKGPCCSNMDGTALSDVDWEAKDGHYRVRIDNLWWDVPDNAVIEEPNRAGVTMVWPTRFNDLNGSVTIEIRCFMPGSMT